MHIAYLEATWGVHYRSIYGISYQFKRRKVKGKTGHRRHAKCDSSTRSARPRVGESHLCLLECIPNERGIAVDDMGEFPVRHGEEQSGNETEMHRQEHPHRGRCTENEEEQAREACQT